MLDAAQEHGYDFFRKAVGSLKKGTICFAIYKKSGAVVDDTPFFTALSDGVCMGCKEGNYDFVVRYFYEDEDLGEQLYTLNTSHFAGIILLATEMDQLSLSHFSEVKTPIVILDSYFETLPYSCVLINNIQGAFLATNYLIAKRKAQPGYLRSSYQIGNFMERADGFYKAIRANGMSTSKSVVHNLTPSQEGAYADMKILLREGEELASCYFADNDHIAIGAMTAFKEAGYQVPKEIAVVGFDDLPICRFIDPPLTTIDVPKHYMGETAARHLIGIIEGKNKLPVKIEIGTSLKKRKSV